MKLVKVTLQKTGREIEVLPEEIPGLEAAGLLKEEKAMTQTKEEKKTGSTKLDAGTKPAKNEKAARERMYPKSKRPVNISHANMKNG